MSQLEPVPVSVAPGGLLWELGFRTLPAGYRAARELLPEGVVVRVGRRVLINRSKGLDFIESGGRRRQDQDSAA